MNDRITLAIVKRVSVSYYFDQSSMYTGNWKNFELYDKAVLCVVKKNSLLLTKYKDMLHKLLSNVLKDFNG